MNEQIDEKIEEQIPFNSEKKNVEGIPNLTKWRDFFFPNSGCWIVENIPVIYFKTTKISFNNAFIGLMVCSYSFYIWNKYLKPLLNNQLIIWNYLIPFFYIYSILFLIITQFSNPGYLPWYWSIDKKKNFTNKELRDGKAYHDDQIEFARNSEKPNRSYFSGKSGYIILRADHFCSWVNNWIGIKNHRYFIIAIGSSSFYLSLFIYQFFKTLYLKTHNFSKFYITFIIILSIFFYFVITAQFISQIFQVTKNFTTIERLKHQDLNFYFKNKLEGWEDICGSIKYFYLWCLPIPLTQFNDGFSYDKYPEDLEIHCSCSKHNKPLL